ncbi:MAG: hypothetical protein NT062_07475 [Proteobacteria bacterium]|nr:hypothetical protein [Pseudomonadota bacterium]
MKALARLSLTVAVGLGALGACHPTPPTPPTPHPSPAANPELAPMLTPLAWWPGVWNAPAGVEQWVAAGGTLYGVTLRDDRTFEVMIVDAAEDGSLRFVALPNGLPGVELRERTRASTNTMQTMVFASDERGSIGFTRTGAGLAVRLAILGAPPITTSSLPGDVRPSAELERADRAFIDKI